MHKTIKPLALVTQRLGYYWKLTRMDKPIGSLLLLWPTLSALWLASNGFPKWHILLIFILGTFLMRSAGCAINDFADKNFDLHVQRTIARPLTSGKIKPIEALIVAGVLSLISFILVLFLNTLTILLSAPALLIAATYPYFKRFFAIPQAYLGIAFGFGIPMAYAAVLSEVPTIAWLLLVANVFWTIAYDTEYAIVDKQDDIKLGLRSSAITFGRFDILAIMICYLLMMAIMMWVGVAYYHFGKFFIFGSFLALCCIFHHYFLIRHRSRTQCFRAFNLNNWIGACFFISIVAQLLFD